ncbi:hypothetical protein TRVA0_037S01266 [Trichomonascus vanleenenianus]|uniref:mRNA splicing protein SLU7 n=1 Tax=Trichomonascus vanleenenianus TaxID=2268995 RepID=UPI003ECB7F24
MDQEEKGGYLNHQRKEGSEPEGEWYDRGKPRMKAATKYRRGACTNCGALTHKAADCLERPRKVGAKYSNQDISPDDNIQEITTTYDSKRDRWNGYDPQEYTKVVHKYNEIEQQRIEEDRERKRLKIDTDELDEDELADDEPANPREKLKERHIAPYMKNLDPEDSTFYNPKSRVVHDERLGTINERGHYQRHMTGEAKEFEELQKLATVLDDRSIHLQAGPTAGMLKLRELKESGSKQREDARKKLLDKYGGEQYMAERPASTKELPEPTTTTFTEEKTTSPGESTKSRYEEDVFPGNHQSIWGSYWQDSRWGYKCCKSMIKNSYCVAPKDNSQGPTGS